MGSGLASTESAALLGLPRKNIKARKPISHVYSTMSAGIQPLKNRVGTRKKYHKDLMQLRELVKDGLWRWPSQWLSIAFCHVTIRCLFAHLTSRLKNIRVLPVASRWNNRSESKSANHRTNVKICVTMVSAQLTKSTTASATMVSFVLLCFVATRSSR